MKLLINNMLEPPKIQTTFVGTLNDEPKFLQIAVEEVQFDYPDNTSKSAVVNRVVRRAEDAVVICAYFWKTSSLRPHQELHVYLRSCHRPAVSLRENYNPMETGSVGNFWELPAGLIEKDEENTQGILFAGLREMEEELGFPSAKNITYLQKISFLGKRVFPAIGMSGERLFFLSIEVDPSQRKNPSSDGSPFEYGGEVISCSVKQALQEIKEGYLTDAKTEIGIRRLAEKFGIT